MHIVYIAYCEVPGPSAAGVHVMRMSQALADIGHDVVLLAGASADAELRHLSPHEYYGTTSNFRVRSVEHVRARAVGRFSFAVRCIGKIRALSPDLVYGRDLFSCYLSATLGYRTVYEVHHPIYQEGALKRFLLTALLRSTSLVHIVVVSDALRRAFIAEANVPEHRIIVAHDASDDLMRGDTPRSIQDSGGRCNVGYVGSLHAGKGLEVIEHVAPLAPRAFFHIVGGTAQQVKLWRTRLCYENVHFYGHVMPAEVPGYIRAMDICLLPNQPSVRSLGGCEIGQFTSPLKLFEYMAAAKPIICSDLPVLREVVDSTTAVLVSPTNWTQWASAIDHLAKNDKRRTELGRAAYQRFIRSHSWMARSQRVVPTAG